MSYLRSNNPIDKFGFTSNKVDIISVDMDIEGKGHTFSFKDADVYQPSLKYQDYSLTQVLYDRAERSRMAVTQGRFTEETFIKPYLNFLFRYSQKTLNYLVDIR